MDKYIWVDCGDGTIRAIRTSSLRSGKVIPFYGLWDDREGHDPRSRKKRRRQERLLNQRSMSRRARSSILTSRGLVEISCRYEPGDSEKRIAYVRKKKPGDTRTHVNLEYPE